RPVGAEVATLEPDDRLTSCELGQDRPDRLTIIGVDVLDERYSQQLDKAVPQAKRESRIGAFQVPVEPHDAKRILRKLEQPHRLVVKRLASRSHSNLVSSAYSSDERPEDRAPGSAGRHVVSHEARVAVPAGIGLASRRI